MMLCVELCTSVCPSHNVWSQVMDALVAEIEQHPTWPSRSSKIMDEFLRREHLELHDLDKYDGPLREQKERALQKISDPMSTSE